jgi:putative nucleotidyltransferase with HDIG domain
MHKISIPNITTNRLLKNKFLKELPKFYSLKNNIENNPWHKNQTTFDHTILVLKALKKNIQQYKNLHKYLNQKVETNTRQDILFTATMFHDIAKPQTQIITKEGWTMFPNHEKESANLAKNILKQFNLTTKEINLICEIIQNHDEIHHFLNQNPTETSLEKIKQIHPNIFIYILLLTKSDTEGSNLKELFPSLFQTRIEIFDQELSHLKI